MKNCILLFTCLLLSIISKSQSFKKITIGPVVNSPSDSRSVNWIDFNNDNYLDLMITNGLKEGENNFLYINKGDGTFESIDSNQSIINDHSPSDGATWADFDNDGDLDCFVATWFAKKNLLYSNNGDGTFKQIKTGSIVNDLTYSETASWIDYNNDGKLDLYVTNSEGTKRNFLYQGNADTTFTKITSGTWLLDGNKSRSVNWIDIDDDNDLDVFVTNENNENENLYLNIGVGSYIKSTNGPLLNSAGNTMSSSFADYDNDGDFDVILANDGSENLLFKNIGNGIFEKDSLPFIRMPNSFGTAWADIDNDADLDLYITNSFGIGKLRNFLYINNGDGSFSIDDSNNIVIDSGWSYGCAFGDYNNDGFLDLAVANCYNKTQVNSLFENNGNSNNWFMLECVGTVSNRSGIGAKIKLKVNINGKDVWQMRDINSQSGYCGQNMFAAHFGLANANIIDSLIIVWPSGIFDTYTNININQKLKAIESISLGKNLIEKKSKVNIYPNPFSNNIKFQFKDLSIQNVSIKVFDLQGKLIFQKDYNLAQESSLINLNTEKWASGSYCMIISNGKEILGNSILQKK